MFTEFQTSQNCFPKNLNCGGLKQIYYCLTTYLNDLLKIIINFVNNESSVGALTLISSSIYTKSKRLVSLTDKNKS